DKSWWHAVLNIAEDPDFIASFLAHPASEPEYRKKRSHSEFISSLKSENYELNIPLFKKSLKQEILNSKLFSY
ncbi:MAG: hypothetical protein GX879_07800, partial [Bacteroidales bacterium]|nr:hypothetical protein [Bacteroidales bacterium]